MNENYAFQLEIEKKSRYKYAYLKQSNFKKLFLVLAWRFFDSLVFQFHDLTSKN